MGKSPNAKNYGKTYKKLWKITIFHGKIKDFDWAMLSMSLNGMNLLSRALDPLSRKTMVVENYEP